MELFGGGFEASGEVGGVAHHGEFVANGVTDLADGGGSVVEADAGGEFAAFWAYPPGGVHAGHGEAHSEGGVDGAAGVFGGAPAMGIAPSGEDGVADEAEERAIFGENGVDHSEEVFVELGDELGGGDGFGPGAEATDIGEENRGLLHLACESGFEGGLVGEDQFGDASGEVDIEHAAEALAFDSFEDEIIEETADAPDGEEEEWGGGGGEDAVAVIEESEGEGVEGGEEGESG